jgi:hypothetical protein
LESLFCGNDSKSEHVFKPDMVRIPPPLHTSEDEVFIKLYLTIIIVYNNYNCDSVGLDISVRIE